METFKSKCISLYIYLRIQINNPKKNLKTLLNYSGIDLYSQHFVLIFISRYEIVYTNDRYKMYHVWIYL